MHTTLITAPNEPQKIQAVRARKTWDHVTCVDPGVCNKILSNYK